MNEPIFLFLLWMGAIMKQQTQNCCQQKTYNYSMNQQPNWLELVLHGEQNQGHSTGEVCWKYFYFDFCFMSPKWTKTKIEIGITLSLEA